MNAWGDSWGSAWAPDAWQAGVYTQYEVYGATVAMKTRPAASTEWACCDNQAVIPAGNAVMLDVAWLDVDGAPAVPTSVRYQVFEHGTGVAVSADINVPGMAARMEIVIPGGNLAPSGVPRRRLVIQVEGVMADGQHTFLAEVYVRKLYVFS